jgi:hypothetical protein
MLYIFVEHSTLLLQTGMQLRYSPRVESSPDLTGVYTKKMRVHLYNIIKN